MNQRLAGFFSSLISYVARNRTGLDIALFLTGLMSIIACSRYDMTCKDVCDVATRVHKQASDIFGMTHVSQCMFIIIFVL